MPRPEETTRTAWSAVPDSTPVPGTHLDVGTARVAIEQLWLSADHLPVDMTVLMRFADALLALLAGAGADHDRLLVSAGWVAEEVADLDDRALGGAALLPLCVGLSRLLVDLRANADILDAALAVRELGESSRWVVLSRTVLQRWPGASAFWLDMCDQVFEVARVELADGPVDVRTSDGSHDDGLWQLLVQVSFDQVPDGETMPCPRHVALSHPWLRVPIAEAVR